MARTTDVNARFWAKVVMGGSDQCWPWTGCLVHNGYGQFNLGAPTRRRVYAHRFAYQQKVGGIPHGLDLDHLCRNRACVNPEHLEPVTRRENLKRGINGHRTHCSRGHEFTEANTYNNPSGFRVCRTCKKDWQREWRLGKELEQT